MVQGPCGVGVRFPSLVSRYEWEQVRVIYLALNSAHLVSGGRDNIGGGGEDSLCMPDWPRIGYLHQTLQTQRDALASASWVLGLNVLPLTLRWLSLCSMALGLGSPSSPF